MIAGSKGANNSISRSEKVEEFAHPLKWLIYVFCTIDGSNTVKRDLLQGCYILLVNETHEQSKLIEPTKAR